MKRPKEFLLEVTVMVDPDEVDTHARTEDKKKEITKAIENLDASIGIFTVENIQ